MWRSTSSTTPARPSCGTSRTNLNFKDPNFRPSYVRIGGDGALYITDWQNPIIGHLQHNLRDPNRDRMHGRVYRITQDGRPMRKPVKMRGMNVDQVVEQLTTNEDDVRYRARLELTVAIMPQYSLQQ